MKLRIRCLLAALAAASIASARAQPAPNTIDAHLAAATRGSGVGWRGRLGAPGVAPANAPPRDVAPGRPPASRKNWYTEPAKVFDDVYFVGTKDRSAWVLPTGDGLILIDTTFEYEAEEVIV